MRNLRGIENADGMYHFKQNNPIQECKNKMPFEFKWNQGKACRINPSKYGYTQAANSMLKTINFNLEDIKDWAILDSGATSHFLVTDASATGISVATNPITVTIPDGTKLTSTHKRELDLPLLPKAARTGHVIPGMSSHSLVSVVTLCNAGYRVVFGEWGIGVTFTRAVVIRSCLVVTLARGCSPAKEPAKRRINWHGEGK